MLDLGVPIEQVNYLARPKSMAMTKRYDHANEERYGAAIEALDAGRVRRAVRRRWRRRATPLPGSARPRKDQVLAFTGEIAPCWIARARSALQQFRIRKMDTNPRYPPDAPDAGESLR